MQTKTANIVVLTIVVISIALLIVTIVLAAVYGSKPTPQYAYVQKPASAPRPIPQTRPRRMAMHAAPRMGTDGNVDVLEEIDPLVLRSVLAKPKPALVMVYADWCGFCKKMQPVMEAMAASGEPEQYGVTLYKMNSKMAGDVLDQYEINGYPVLLANFGAKKYVGYKDADGLRAIMRETMQRPTLAARMMHGQSGSGTAVPEVDDEEAVLAMLQEPSTPVVAMVFADWCGYCKKMNPVMQEASRTAGAQGVKMVKINADRAAKLKRNYGIRGFPVLLTNFGDKKYVGYKDLAGVQSVLEDAKTRPPQAAGQHTPHPPPTAAQARARMDRVRFMKHQMQVAQ